MRVSDAHPHDVNPRRIVSPSLARLAEVQAGVVTTEQAVSLGQTRHSLARLVGDGRWRRLASGLYLASPAEPNFSALAWGGVLLGGQGSRLGPRASAHLHELEKRAPGAVDVLVPADRRIRVAGPWEFVRDSSANRSTRTIGQPPRLVIDDAVIDFAALIKEPDVVGLVTQAVSSHKTTAPRLLRTLERRGRHPHRALLRDMLADVAEGAESPIELRYLRDVERPHALPNGRRQKSRLGLRYCSDVGYDKQQLLVELDGRDAHQGTARFRDMRRDNRFAARYHVTLRYGFYDLTHHPCAVAGQVWSVLAERGWPDVFTHCRRCRNTPLTELVQG